MALYLNNSRQIKRANLLSKIDEQFAYPVEDYLVAGETEAMLDQVVNKMPETMRKAFELSRKEHLSIKEIAARMGLSEQTVKNNITAALQRLRNQLSAEHVIFILPLVIFLN
jgi:DNA-directed RNA polymerase specialized sigma subunit, sigma24 homolog